MAAIAKQDAAAATSIESVVPAIEPLISHVDLYTTPQNMYLIGTADSVGFRILTIDRVESEGEKLIFNMDMRVYTKEEKTRYLSQLSQLNPKLKHVSAGYGVLGFVRFTQGYYVHLLTKRSAHPIGTIGKHYIYSSLETKIFPVCTSLNSSSIEARHKKSYTSLDLGKGDCFLSYTYDLTNTLQENVASRGRAREAGTLATPCNDRFIWNAHALRGLSCYVGVPSVWLLPLIHGFFEQTKIKTNAGRSFLLTLLARRSRHFAGTRFNRRGSDIRGNVANEVETEQLLCDEGSRGMCTSLVQVRGSIPLHWSHVNLRAPKPAFQVYYSDPEYKAARLHFDNLGERYGAPIASVNLIRQEEPEPKELILLSAYDACIRHLNDSRAEASQERGRRYSKYDVSTGAAASGAARHDATGEFRSAEANRRHLALREPIRYIAYDFNTNAKKPGVDVLDVVTNLAQGLVESTGFFYSKWCKPDIADNTKTQDGGHTPAQLRRWVSVAQTGIVRTNCIDCLDRTNAAQFCIGNSVLERQLAVLGVKLHPSSENTLWPQLMKMWARHGNQMGKQYAGSGAMHSLSLSKLRRKGKTSDLSSDSGNTSGDRNKTRSQSSGSLGETDDSRDSFESLGLPNEGPESGTNSLSEAIESTNAPSLRVSSDKDLRSPQSTKHRHLATDNSIGKIGLTKGVKNAMVAVTRYISNNFSDSVRQASMDIFLGTVHPTEEQMIRAFQKANIPDEGNMPISAVAETPVCVCLCVLKEKDMWPDESTVQEGFSRKMMQTKMHTVELQCI